MSMKKIIFSIRKWLETFAAKNNDSNAVDSLMQQLQHVSLYLSL